MTDPRTPSAVRFSPEERALIQKAAEEAGLPFTSYVRMVALAAAKGQRPILSDTHAAR